MAKAQALEQLVRASRGLLRWEAGTSRAEQQLLANGSGQELVLGVLEDGPDVGGKLLRRPPRDRLVPAAWRKRLARDDGSPSNPARRRASVDFPLPVGPTSASASDERSETLVAASASSASPG
jgi:hypothetical protein